jgi:ABC-type transport system substrate-binding protein
MAAGWRTAGFAVEEGAFSAAQAVQAGDAQTMATFRSLFTQSNSAGVAGLEWLAGYGAAGPDNRWLGRNRSGWVNPEFDRYVEALQTTLDPDERGRHAVGLARVLSEDAAAVPLFFNPAVYAYPAELHGISLASPQAAISWNMHEWEWR